MANTETTVSNLKINRLTQTQLENASSLSNTEAYWVDPQFTGDKPLITDSNGDIVETSKNTVVGWGMPDYSAGVAKSEGTAFTVTEPCLLQARATYSAGGSMGLTVKINNETFSHSVQGNLVEFYYCYYFLSAGDEVTVTMQMPSYMTCNITVFPLKGAS